MEIDFNLFLKRKYMKQRNYNPDKQKYAAQKRSEIYKWKKNKLREEFLEENTRKVLVEKMQS